MSDTEPETVKELLDLFRSRVTSTVKRIKEADHVRKKDMLRLEADVWREAQDVTEDMYIRRLRRASDQSTGDE